MGIEIHPGSLSQTVDSVNESTFFSSVPSAGQRLRIARWISQRQGLPGCYGGMFAGFDSERGGIRLFTGEKISSASARHILGEEACRALRLLKVDHAAVSRALDRADQGMLKCLHASDRERGRIGWFCCGKCSVGMWRNLLSGGLDRKRERLENGIEILREHRDAEAGWKRFPFWYTVLALVEIGGKSAKTELSRVASKLSRAAASPDTDEVYSMRRQTLARRAMAMVDKRSA